MTMFAPENYTYYAGMMLVFSAGYFFIKLRFFLATIAGWSILLIYNIGAIYYTHTPDELLINNNFFFISANLIGMFAAYNIEYYTRRNFFLSQKLDNERLLVLDANKNLERTVEERTKELLKAKEQAEESDRLKSAFLANMSHEIRTPMNGILGFAELLKEPGLTGEEQQDYIRIIEKSGARMLNIINDIVDISKIEAGLMKLEIQESNINEQIQDIYTFFKPEVEAKGMILSFNTPLPTKEAILKTDREKVYAILTNLVKNAIKYSNTGTIEIGYSKRDSDLEFYVKDTGIGIPNDRHGAIFERFIQADIPDEWAQQGAGLGLSITKAYVEMLGGKIRVASQVGVGSTFYFTLPYNAVLINEPVIQQIVPSDNNDLIRKLKILIAEDDKVSEMLIDKTLKTFGKEIIKARTGVEAIEACKKNPDIDLVMMDIRMPDMGGYDATRQIRKFNKEVVIIAQTAHGLYGDREKAIEAGCNDYIAKPINKAELLLLIQKYFHK
ncbi:MAG: response regulator [Ignavibacteriales bacterium]|nr:response regulator [Ignavibacteriales bacterium]